MAQKSAKIVFVGWDENFTINVIHSESSHVFIYICTSFLLLPYRLNLVCTLLISSLTVTLHGRNFKTILQEAFSSKMFRYILYEV